MGMPIGRYFVVMGSLILAMLFLADWYLPKPTVEGSAAAIDKTVIRIHSAHKWPEAIVIDTSLPTIVQTPPIFPESTGELPQQAESTRQAFAQAAPEAAAARVKLSDADTKPVRKRLTRIVRANARVASYDFIGFRNTFPAGW